MIVPNYNNMKYSAGMYAFVKFSQTDSKKKKRVWFHPSSIGGSGGGFSAIFGAVGVWEGEYLGTVYAITTATTTMTPSIRAPPTPSMGSTATAMVKMPVLMSTKTDMQIFHREARIAMITMHTPILALLL